MSLPPFSTSEYDALDRFILKNIEKLPLPYGQQYEKFLPESTTPRPISKVS